MSEATQALGVIATLFGVTMAAMGSLGAFDAYTTMHQIEATGVIGQAVYEQQYEQAIENLELLGAVGVSGLSLVIFGAAVYIGGVLEQLTE